MATVLLLAAYFSGIESVRFHKDESAWIGTSYYLEAFLGQPVHELRPDLPPSVWTDRFETLTHPPLGKYIIGVGRRLGGYAITDLNVPWNHMRGPDADAAAGQVPSARLLLWARRPMALLSVVTGLLLFSLVVRCEGLIAGYAFVVLFSANPFFLKTLRRAMGDATVTLFGIAALAATVRALDSWQRSDIRKAWSRAALKPAFWFVVAGLLCGSAGASKLNGLVTAAGVVAAAVIAVVRGSRDLGLWARSRVAIAAAGLVLASAAIAFVAPNPYLYPNPLERTAKMFELRLSEVRRQRSQFPSSSLDGLADRAKATGRRVLWENSAIQYERAWPFTAGLMALGGLALLRRAVRSLAARAPDTAFVVLAVGGGLMLPACFTPLDWERYFLFPVLFAHLCLAIGLAVIAKSAWSGLRERRLRLARPATRGAPPAADRNVP